MKLPLTVPRGNPSNRLPDALVSRYIAGDSITQLSVDYHVPEEQIRWGVELGALRLIVEHGAGTTLRRHGFDAIEKLRKERV